MAKAGCRHKASEKLAGSSSLSSHITVHSATMIRVTSGMPSSHTRTLNTTVAALDRIPILVVVMVWGEVEVEVEEEVEGVVMVMELMLTRLLCFGIFGREMEGKGECVESM